MFGDDMGSRYKYLLIFGFAFLYLIACNNIQTTNNALSTAHGDTICMLKSRRAIYVIDVERQQIMVYRCINEGRDALKYVSARYYAFDMELHEYPEKVMPSVDDIKSNLSADFVNIAKTSGKGISACVYEEKEGEERLAVLNEVSRRLAIYELTEKDHLRLLACRNILYDSGVVELNNERPNVRDIKILVEKRKAEEVEKLNK
jgi:hypothetical protein